MTVPSWRKATWVSAFVAAAAGNAGGQAATECDATLVNAQQSTATNHPQRFFARVKPLLDRQQYRQAIERLIEQFDDDHALPANDPRRLSIRKRLIQFRNAVADSAGIDAARDAAIERKELSPSFEISANPTTEAFELFPDDADKVIVSDTTDIARRRAICWTAISAQKIRSPVRYPEFARAVAILEQTLAEWRTYQEKGYSAYPWESLMMNWWPFSKCLETNLGPPKCAPVAFHANPSVEVSKPAGIGWSELRSQPLIAWDVLGFVKYRHGWRDYWGVAAVVTTGANQSPGIGATIHLGSAADVGAVFRGAGTTGPRRSLTLSVDAYKAVAGIPAKFARARDNVASALQAARVSR